MDVYLFVVFLGGRSRRNDFGQGWRYKEGGMRKGGFYPFTLLPFYLFTFLPFYLFTSLPFYPFYSFTFLRISKLLRGRCCDQACIDVLFVSPLLMCRF